VEWQPDHALRVQMKDFSHPLPGLATGFEESCVFQRIDYFFCFRGSSSGLRYLIDQGPIP
jgi:hypothetical protein